MRTKQLSSVHVQEEKTCTKYKSNLWHLLEGIIHYIVNRMYLDRLKLSKTYYHFLVHLWELRWWLRQFVDHHQPNHLKHFVLKWAWGLWPYSLLIYLCVGAIQICIHLAIITVVQFISMIPTLLKEVCVHYFWPTICYCSCINSVMG
jgi:hypothetical protein